MRNQESRNRDRLQIEATEVSSKIVEVGVWLCVFVQFAKQAQIRNCAWFNQLANLLCLYDAGL